MAITALDVIVVFDFMLCCADQSVFDIKVLQERFESADLKVLSSPSHIPLSFAER